MDIWSAVSGYLNRYVITGGLVILSVSCYKWLDSNKKWKQEYHSKVWFGGLGERMDTLHKSKKESLFLRSNLEGDIVEIGTADGYNLKYYLEYADKIKSLTCIEPSLQFFDALKPKVENFPFPVKLYNGTFEEFVASRQHAHVEDKFDVIISILLLCSVDSPVGVITDCHALLKPGGRLVLLEHNRNRESYFWRFIQSLCNPIWRIIKNDCRLNRDTHADISCVHWERFDCEFYPTGRYLIGEYYTGVAIK